MRIRKRDLVKAIENMSNKYRKLQVFLGVFNMIHRFVEVSIAKLINLPVELPVACNCYPWSYPWSYPLLLPFDTSEVLLVDLLHG